FAISDRDPLRHPTCRFNPQASKDCDPTSAYSGSSHDAAIPEPALHRDGLRTSLPNSPIDASRQSPDDGDGDGAGSLPHAGALADLQPRGLASGAGDARDATPAGARGAAFTPPSHPRRPP